MTPLTYLLIRDIPEEVGLLPDNEIQHDKEIENSGISYETSWTPNEALRNRSFWLIIYTIIIPSAIITGLIFHQISLLGEIGLRPETASLISTVMSVIRLPIILVAGQIADRYDVRYLMIISQKLLFSSMLALLFADGVYLVILYGVLIGVQMGIHGIVGGVVWPEYFGRKHLSTIRGVTMMAGVIGSALGPLPYGLAYDICGGYREAITASLMFPLLGIAAGFRATKPIKN
jgi:MFS family permease